jgi:hypothetical protein
MARLTVVRSVGEASMERGEPAGQGEKAAELTEQPGGDEAAQ